MIENNPDVDYGSPGPLVHFVERFYKKGYERKLIDSIKRRPTRLTVWMLNRIINGVEGDMKQYYIKILSDILKFPNLEESVIDEVNSFLDFQG